MKETGDRELCLIEDLLRQRYAPAGEEDDLTYMTTAEIMRELEDMVHASLMDMAGVLQGGGFSTQVIDGVVYWRLYEVHR